MKYLGQISGPKDLVRKEYVDDADGALSTRIDTNEDNIAMAESDIESLQGDVNTLKTDNTATKAAVKTLQDTYIPNTRKVNNKALDADITLTASDVGAQSDEIFFAIYNKSTSEEIGEAYNAKKKIFLVYENQDGTFGLMGEMYQVVLLDEKPEYYFTNINPYSTTATTFNSISGKWIDHNAGTIAPYLGFNDTPTNVGKVPVATDNGIYNLRKLTPDDIGSLKIGTATLTWDSENKKVTATITESYNTIKNWILEGSVVYLNVTYQMNETSTYNFLMRLNSESSSPLVFCSISFLLDENDMLTKQFSIQYHPADGEQEDFATVSYQIIPLQTSLLTNDSNFVSAQDVVDTETTTGIDATTLEGQNIGYFAPNELVQSLNQQIQSFIGILNGLSEVAITGSYNDLTDQPTIPTIYSGTTDPSASLGQNGDIYIKYSG